jgi:hypothetical protein
MGFKEIFTRIEETLGGLPGVFVYCDNPPADAKPDFIVWSPMQAERDAADNSPYSRVIRIGVDAYVWGSKSNLPDELEKLFDSAGYTYGDPAFEWDEKFRCRRVQWDVEVVMT